MKNQLVAILKHSDHFELGCLEIMGQRNFLIKKMYFSSRIQRFL